ncbi:MAG TPA: 8-amino-7-oxononanoate synthase [Polyangiaceae bacterium]|nr:8-amino-7-oxononanoate synthase [Polyangiaceae bacterium]
MRFEALVDQVLADLRAGSLLREPDDGTSRKSVAGAAERLGVAPLDASSNDYLGFATRAVSRETLGNPGAAASRLIYGSTAEHLALESDLASWVGAETALFFSSTYAANLGLISALGVPGSVILSDSANHASLIDGARLSKATVQVLPHLDLDALGEALATHRKARAVWVVTESYFSMDGDGPDLRATRALCDEYDACLIVDEAHALGVFGPTGAGRCAEVGMKPDILVGALGKAVGTQGGFVAGSRQLRTFLWNKARSFVFSTAPSPRLADLSRVHVQLAREAKELRNALSSNAAALRTELQTAQLPLAPDSFGPIVSVILGDNERVLAAAERLRGLGVLAQAIRPPTVPVGGARLRLTVKATFTPAEIARLTRAVREACAS